MFKVARDAVRRELERYRNRDFLDAAMAATALVASADGDIGITELYARDAVIKNIDELSVFDPSRAVDAYRQFATAISENPQDGRQKALESISRLAGEPDQSRTLVRACIAIGKSDGNFCDSEVEVVQSICNALGIDPNDAAFSDSVDTVA